MYVSDTPSLSGVVPKISSVQSEKFLVTWQGWIGPHSLDAQLHYRVIYSLHHSHGSSNITNVTMVAQKRGIESFLLTGLAVNTRYIVTVEPYIRLNDREITGVRSGSTLPSKTQCESE